ncbi:MAG: molybdopterin-guanine dinucleotide biosynthesis protein B [Alphaproteobacteria bacterium]|nr:molybdopterin-guanine dinucleotide biosynthesis protein B [Alphaproteobacteria bacterium]
MKILGIVGWSGSGKTTLLTKLIPELVARRISVSTVKHAHHAFDVDRPGKDSHRHREAGATEVLVSSPARWALMHENRGAPEAELADLLPRMTPVDLVLIEGFKRHPHDKLEVHRPAVGKPLLAAGDRSVVAVASSELLPDLPLPQLALDDIPAIAEFVLRHCGLAPPPHDTADR